MIDTVALEKTQSPPETLQGIGICPGIVTGQALIVDRRFGRQQHRYIQTSKAAEEINRLHDAVECAEKALFAIRDAFAVRLGDYAAIIDSHALILRDNLLFNRAAEIIRKEAVNAEWAIEKAMAHIEGLFKGIDDPYLRDRFLDIEHVASRLLHILSGAGPEFFERLREPVILIAHDLPPEDIIRLPTGKIIGVAIETGSKTSHCAIVLHSLGIPAVVGVGGLTGLVAAGDMVVIDGSRGRVNLNPTEITLQRLEEDRRQQQLYNRRIAAFAPLAPQTVDGLTIGVAANIEMPEEVGQAMEYGAGGIGLFRSEYYYMTRPEIPTEEELFALYKGLLTSVSPLPVTIRTLDIGGDKKCASIMQGSERNPALGLRAIRFSLKERHLFHTQIRALLRASAFGNLRLMFPMVSTACELTAIREIITQVQHELTATDWTEEVSRAPGMAQKRPTIPFSPTLAIGAMIEVPSAVSVADVLATQVDFFSIGTNDLVQYALAVDRDNLHVSHLYEPLNPAVIRMIRQVTTAGHGAGIEVSVCGEMASDINNIPLLLGLGVDEFSMPPLAIPYVKKIIRASSMRALTDLARDAAACSRAEEIHALLNSELPRLYPQEYAEGIFRQVHSQCCATYEAMTREEPPLAHYPYAK